MHISLESIILSDSNPKPKIIRLLLKKEGTNGKSTDERRAEDIELIVIRNPWGTEISKLHKATPCCMPIR